MDKKLIEDTIKKYQDQLDDEEHFKTVEKFLSQDGCTTTERMDQKKN